MPSASTVASAMALGSAGSLRVGFLQPLAKSRSGSSAAVKSPTVNPLGCSIGAASDMSGVPVWLAQWLAVPLRLPVIVEAPWQAYGWPRRRLRFAALERLRGVRRLRLDVQQDRKDDDRPTPPTSEDVTGSVASPRGDAASTAELCLGNRPGVRAHGHRRRALSAAARRSARRGKIRRAARAAPSRRSPAPMPRTARPAAISWRAMCAGRGRKPGCRARPAGASQGSWEVADDALAAVLKFTVNLRRCPECRNGRHAPTRCSRRPSAPHCRMMSWAGRRFGGRRISWSCRMRDPYEVLGVQKNASPAAIKSAFRQARQEAASRRQQERQGGGQVLRAERRL